MDYERVKLSKAPIRSRLAFVRIHSKQCDGVFQETTHHGRAQSRHQCPKCGAVALTFNPLIDTMFEGHLPRKDLPPRDEDLRLEFPNKVTCSCGAKLVAAPGEKVKCPACGHVNQGNVPHFRRGRSPDFEEREKPTMYRKASITGNYISRRVKA